MPTRIVTGRTGGDMVKTAKQDRQREEYARGRLTPKGTLRGISTNCDGHMRRGGDVAEGEM